MNLTEEATLRETVWDNAAPAARAAGTPRTP